MTTCAHAAADQLVRLTRLIVRTDNPEFPPDSPRILRHNGAELSGQEQQVFRALVRGDYDTRLAELLQLPAAAIHTHRTTLRTDFHTPAPPPPPEPPATPGAHATAPSPDVQQPPARSGPWRRPGRQVVVAAAVLGVAGGLAAAEVGEPGRVVRGGAWHGVAGGLAAVDPMSPMGVFGVSTRQAARLPKLPALPSGIATATSFWDRSTASLRPMSYRTIASPYWPLGTKVRISHGNCSAIGIVQDFGPAEWAVAQHDIPAIIDISESMMADLTGSRKNAVHVRFAVLAWGPGPAYRMSGPGYALATEGSGVVNR